MGKVKIPMTEEILKIWIAEKIEEFVVWVDLHPQHKPSDAREHWLLFARYLKGELKNVKGN
jgi:hypothetical protein